MAFHPKPPPTALHNSGFLKNINLIRSFVFSPLEERRLYIPEEAQWLAGAEVRTGATADRRQGPLWGDDWTVGMVAQLRKFTRNYRTVPIKEMSFMGCMLYLKKIVKKQRKPRQVSRLLPGRGPARPSVSRRAPRVPCVRAVPSWWPVFAQRLSHLGAFARDAPVPGLSCPWATVSLLLQDMAGESPLPGSYPTFPDQTKGHRCHF